MNFELGQRTAMYSRGSASGSSGPGPSHARDRGREQEERSTNPLEELESFKLRFPGLKGLIDECRRVYPDQPNPLQVHSLLKSW